MIICGNLGWFVAEKSSQKNIRVIREICGFRLRIQKSYNIFGIHSKFITPIASFASHRSHRSHRLSLWVGNLTDALLLCFQRLTRIQRDSTRRLFVEICVNSWQKNLRKNIRVIRGICGFKATPQISTNFYKLFVG